MNKWNMKKKLVIDLILAVLLASVMSYSFTGGLLHELIGFALIFGSLIHVAVHCNYYKAMFKAAWKGQVQGGKAKLSFLLNVLLLIDLPMMFLSSLAISKDIVPGIAMFFGNYLIWRTIHVVSAIVLSCLALTHVCLHYSLFDLLFEKAIASKTVMKGWKLGSRLLAMVLVVMLVKANIEYASVTAALMTPTTSVQKEVKNSDDNIKGQQSEEIETVTEREAETESETIVENSPESEIQEASEKKEEIEATEQGSSEVQASSEIKEESAEEAPSLEEYLGKLFCNGCGKHCSLLSPRCGKGMMQANQATEDYYATYQE